MSCCFKLSKEYTKPVSYSTFVLCCRSSIKVNRQDGPEGMESWKDMEVRSKECHFACPTMGEYRGAILGLYKKVLRCHSNNLDGDARAFGDNYARSEFRTIRKMKNETQLRKFVCDPIWLLTS